MHHSDQSDEAKRAAHSAQDGICPECRERYGWWQGLTVVEDSVTEWQCAACAAISKKIPPPPGFLVLEIHPTLWTDHGLQCNPNVTSCIKQTSDALPCLIAWAMETRWLSSSALSSSEVIIPRKEESAWKKGKIPRRYLTPVILRQPHWWSGSETPHLWNYIGSKEDQLFEECMQAALDLEESQEWRRSYFPDDSIEWSDFSGVFGRWSGAVPTSHPLAKYRQRRFHMLPWHAIKYETNNGEKKVNDQTFGPEQVKKVEEGIAADFRSMCIFGDDSLPSLWSAIEFPSV